LELQWLEEADIARQACGITIEEVQAAIRHGHDEPNPGRLLRGRRLKLHKLEDGRTIRVEYAESRDGAHVTVQFVTIDLERLQ